MTTEFSSEAPTRPNLRMPVNALGTKNDQNIYFGPETHAAGNIGSVSYGLAAHAAPAKDNAMTLNNSDEARVEERRSAAWELRVKGKSYREIGIALGVSHVTAFKDITSTLERIKADNNETAEHHRNVQLARLDRALDTVYDALTAELKTGTDAEDKVQLGPDHEMRLKALDRLMKLEERRAKLLGLDAPAKVSAEITNVGLDEIDELRKSAMANEVK